MNRRDFLLWLSALGTLPSVTGIGAAHAGSTASRPARRSRAPYAPIPPGYIQTGNAEHVPPLVLYGVALQESAQMFGDYVLPYPWTLNVAGLPKRFSTRRAAVAGLEENVRRGITSVDCGLMQVNWRYHRDKLGDYHQALDPYRNLRVGARILRGHFADTGNWFTAIGRYHSPSDTARANAYARSVYQRMERVLHA